MKKNITTIDANTDALAGVYFAIAGGKFLVRMDNEDDWSGDVVDSNMNVIGSAHQYSSGSGWAIHTPAYGGFADHSQIVKIVEPRKG